MKNPIVLGVDPGLAHCGWALVEITPNQIETARVLGVDVVNTEARTEREKGRAVRQADHDTHRLWTILRALVAALDSAPGPVVAIAAEIPTGGKGGRAVKSLALVQGCLVALAELRGLPFLVALNADIKLATAGKRSATKDEVRAAVRLRVHPGSISVLDAYERREAKSRIEHAYDAIGSVLAKLDDNAIRVARALSARESEKLPITLPDAAKLEKLLKERPLPPVPPAIQPGPRPMPDGSMILMYGGAPTMEEP